MSAAVSIDVIVAGLAGRIASLCAELFPGGSVEGNEYRIGGVDGSPGRSMAIHLAGDRAGIWQDFATADHKGDALDLVAKALFSGDKSRAVAWSRAWLGYEGGVKPEVVAAARSRLVKAKKDEAERIERVRRAALRLYLEAQPAIAGTPADLYLRGRGLALERLGRQPGALRFHPACRYFEKVPGSDRPVPRGTLPAMIASIVNARGDAIAVHRTYLQVGPDGCATKAAIDEPKKTLGRFLGGWIPLWKGTLPNGREGKRFGELTDKDAAAWVDPSTGEIHDEHANNSVFVSEGIEDGLTVAIVEPRRRVIAGITVGNLVNLQLPPAMRFVTILRQADAPGSKAALAVERALDRWLGEGREVFEVPPPEGFKDINDRLRGQHMEHSA